MEGIKHSLNDIEKDHKWLDTNGLSKCVFCDLEQKTWKIKKKEIVKSNHNPESDDYILGVLSQYYCKRNGESLVRDPRVYQ